MSKNNESAQAAKMTELIEPIADDFHCELVDVDINNGVVKVIIDEEGGLNSQTLVEVTKAVSRMVDAEDPIPGRFTLEVTSPGVERPLKKPDHFRRSVGEKITVKTMPDVPGERRLDATLISADEYGITIESADETRTLKYGEIRSARTIFDWGPTPKKGGKNGPNKKNIANKNTKKGQPA